MLRQLVSNLPSTVCSLAGMLLAAALVAGCSTNPMTGRSQLMLVTEQSAIAQSASHYQAMMGSLEKNGKISTDEALNARVQDITDRLVNQAVRYRPDTRAWAWTVKVIDDPETLNAFCMPGGRMAIFSGMMTRLDASDDEIAQVMGHEIAHALANHGAEKMSVAMAANLAVVAVAAAGRNNSQRVGLYNAATLAALAFINLPNSRQAETEADKLGVELAARAGYDPHAAVTLWSKMLQQKGGRAAPDFLSTHPSTDKRIAALAELEVPMRRLYDPAARDVPVPAWTSFHAAIGQPGAAPGNGPPPAPAEPEEALVFYSESFDRFEQGNTELACTGCAMQFALNQGSLREHHERGAWRKLASEVIKLDYPLDLAYYYLGRAAAGLGRSAAAAVYFGKAASLADDKDRSCAQALVINCAGVDVKRAANAALHPPPAQ